MEIWMEDWCRRIAERYHFANIDDSCRVRLEQQLNQIIDLRTNDLGTVSNEDIIVPILITVQAKCLH